jgi:hypothetical protein
MTTFERECDQISLFMAKMNLASHNEVKKLDIAHGMINMIVDMIQKHYIPSENNVKRVEQLFEEIQVRLIDNITCDVHRRKTMNNMINDIVRCLKLDETNRKIVS